MAEKIGLVKEIIAEVLGEEPKIFKTKNAYFFTRENGVPCQIKIVQQDQTHLLDTEAALYRFISRETSLPAPEILGKGQWGTLSYLIFGTFSGPTLQDNLDSGENEEKVLFSAGQYLGILHSIELHQQGYLKPDLGIRKKQLFAQEEYQKIIRERAEKKIIPGQVLAELMQVNIDFFFQDKSNVLCHGEFIPGNLYAEQTRIKGIVGWERAHAAPPFLDLARFILEIKNLEKNISPGSFYEGYSRVKPLTSIYLEHEEFYKFYALLFSPALDREKGKELLLTLVEAREKWPKTNLEPTP